MRSQNLYPNEEDARAAALSSLGILDSPPEERFDRICREAREVMATPAAYVSLIDRHRQWFKASLGMGELKETPREGTFCDYAIRRSRPTIVLDATRDPLFAKSPYVTGPPHVRFYAGFPLTVKGQRVGTLCCLDFQAREGVAADQIEQMQGLARRVELELLNEQSPADAPLELPPAEFCRVTLLQVQVADFVEQSAGCEAGLALHALRAFHRQAESLIRDWGGILVTTTGDSLRAVFAIDNPSHTLRAARCAVEMLIAAYQLGEALEHDGWSHHNCSVALSVGRVLLGRVDDALVATGRPVVEVSQIAELTEAGEILVSNEVHDELGELARFEESFRTRLGSSGRAVRLHRLGAVSMPGDVRC